MATMTIEYKYARQVLTRLNRFRYHSA